MHICCYISFLTSKIHNEKSIRIWIKIEQSQVFIAFKVICFIFEKLFISCKNFQFMAKTFKGYYKTARTRVSFFYINWIKLNTCSHKNLHNGKCLIVSRLKMCTIRMLKHRGNRITRKQILDEYVTKYFIITFSSKSWRKSPKA